MQALKMASTKIALVLRYPSIALHPALQRKIESNSDSIKVILEQDLTSDNRPLVKGILQYGFMKVTSQFMASFPNLRVVSTSGAGIEHIDVEAATRRGIRVGNTPHAVNDCTADLAFALLLASARNVVQGDAISKNADFKQFDIHWFGTKVSGSTIGIVGLGNIGCAVASRAKGFNMKILYHGRTRKKEAETHLGAEYCRELKDLLQQADFVMLCVPLTQQTRHMITATQLAFMKPSATLINIARGGILNHDDLVTALKNKVIHAAALDVTDPEPLPRDHPLLKLPNVIITPHIGSATETARCEMIEMSLKNVLAGINGEQLPYPVN